MSDHLHENTHSTGNVKFLRLLSQGNIEHLEGFQLSLIGNYGIALDFQNLGKYFPQSLNFFACGVYQFTVVFGHILSWATDKWY
ncbi:MAG: hypothetical protein ACI9J4_000932 [Paraglaciecola sp.]|jgi:hypothetical protein